MNVLEDKFYPNKKLANTTKKKKKPNNSKIVWTNLNKWRYNFIYLFYFIFLWSHSVESDSLLPHGL